MARTYYAERLRAYDWARIARDMDEAARLFRENDPMGGLTLFGLAAADLDPNSDAIRVSAYLGRGYQDSPSQSFYAPWSPVPDRIRERDAAFWDAFERAAQRHGMSLESGDGDPTDTYAMRYYDRSEPS